MATMYTQVSSNIRKTWLLMLLFFVVVIGLGFIFTEIYQNPVILYVAVFASVIMNVISYWFSDTIVLRLHRARPVDAATDRELHHVLENLTITAGLPMPRFFVIDDLAPNAFATGRNPEHAVVAVTSGLLTLLDRSELEGVLAHELSHIGNRDMLVSTVVVVLLGFVSIASDIFLRSLWFHGSGDQDRDRGGNVLMIVGVVFALLAPLFALLLHLAISRKREFLADASGALLTRYPEGLASALEKIGQHARPMRTATNATAHLFLENPFGAHAERGGEKSSFLVRLFSTHPPLAERVRILRAR